MKYLALTPQAKEARKLGIGGSDAYAIVEGGWHGLWLEKTNRIEPEDLSGILAVQMGNATEDFNAYWFEKKGFGHVTARREVRVHPEYKFMRCTLDGLVEDPRKVWQAKHSSGRLPLAELVEHYTPQVCHEMIVTGLDRGVLSIFLGTDRFEVADIELDPFYAADYVERCREFWGYVERDEEPKQGRPLDPPPPVEHFRQVDMTGNNEWAYQAVTWRATRIEARQFEEASRELKAMVERDVNVAAGHGIEIKRSKNGALTIRETTK